MIAGSSWFRGAVGISAHGVGGALSWCELFRLRVPEHGPAPIVDGAAALACLSVLEGRKLREAVRHEAVCFPFLHLLVQHVKFLNVSLLNGEAVHHRDARGRL